MSILFTWMHYYFNSKSSLLFSMWIDKNKKSALKMNSWMILQKVSVCVGMYVCIYIYIYIYIFFHILSCIVFLYSPTAHSTYKLFSYIFYETDVKFTWMKQSPSIWCIKWRFMYIFRVVCWLNGVREFDK